MVQRTGKKPPKKRVAPKKAARKKLRASKAPSRTAVRKKATQKKAIPKKAIPKKAAPRKARSNSATTRSTAGPGYKFEDLTAAWVMVKMLRGEAIPGINDLGEKLQMQTKALGWEIDDLLVAGHGTNGAAAPRLSVSCKSNVQVSSAGLPETFVVAAWAQWRKPGQMRHGLDSISLVTRDRHIAFSAIWADIKTWSADSNIASTLGKINASAKHRKVFDSVRPCCESCRALYLAGANYLHGLWARKVRSTAAFGSIA